MAAKKRAAPDDAAPKALAAQLEWRSGAASPNGRRVLDVHPASRLLLSASTDEPAALIPSQGRRDERRELATEEELSGVVRGFRPER